MRKYTIVVESKTPPQLFLGDKIGEGKIIELKVEEFPNRVTAAWLSERFNLSSKSIIAKIGLYNKGDANKHLYDPKEVMPILENINILNAQRTSRRKN